ncbi:MAG: hypothetical protein ACFCU4_02520 [Puniceicoccaceae bacterium]
MKATTHLFYIGKKKNDMYGPFHWKLIVEWDQLGLLEGFIYQSETSSLEPISELVARRGVPVAVDAKVASFKNRTDKPPQCTLAQMETLKMLGLPKIDVPLDQELAAYIQRRLQMSSDELSGDSDIRNAFAVAETGKRSVLGHSTAVFLPPPDLIDEEGEEAEELTKSGSGLSKGILLVLFVLLLAGGGAAYYFLEIAQAKDQTSQTLPQATETPEELAPELASPTDAVPEVSESLTGEDLPASDSGGPGIEIELPADEFEILTSGVNTEEDSEVTPPAPSETSTLPNLPADEQSEAEDPIVPSEMIDLTEQIVPGKEELSEEDSFERLSENSTNRPATVPDSEPKPEPQPEPEPEPEPQPQPEPRPTPQPEPRPEPKPEPEPEPQPEPKPEPAPKKKEDEVRFPSFRPPF